MQSAPFCINILAYGQGCARRTASTATSKSDTESSSLATPPPSIDHLRIITEIDQSTQTSRSNSREL
ncbi:unnamed protein product [Anisakis simplex]|uniref:Uncharacterized protein n=1 Tax=Anisakis simplex TaxID=6269 RepID=A0A3P6RA73_ANISI|nr:unnamed protein product [Anisakis simplex]